MKALVLTALLALPSAALAQSTCPPGGGTGLAFDGAGDLVNCGNVLPGSNLPHTIEAWVRVPLNPPAPLAEIAGQIGVTCCGTGFGLRYINGQVFYNLNLPSCGTGGMSVYDSATEPGVWHHYAGSWDGGTMKLYRDGLLIGSAAYTSGFGGFTLFSIGSLFVQCGSNQWGSFFTGDIDEVRLWDHVRTDAEILSSFNEPLCGVEGGLVGYWPLDEGMGTNTMDLSSGGHDGSIFGATWIDHVGCTVTSYCTGSTSCPCGNTAPGEGCLNSTGGGAALQAAGTASVTSDDLVLTASGVPALQNGILVMGGGQTCPKPFGGGVLCVDPGTVGICRFPVQNSGAGGLLTQGPGLVALSQTPQLGCPIQSGDTWNFQAWFRDPQGFCGTEGFNLSNALSVTFTP